MRHFKNKKIIYLLIFILTIFSFLHTAYASTLILKQDKTNYDIGEQFFVDILINTDSTFINGIEGNVLYNNLEFLRAEEGTSIIGLWVDKPINKNESIHFLGIIPNGFSGLIDPFNSKIKLPGEIIRLIFQTKKEGSAFIKTNNFYTTLNDGLGTVNHISPTELNLTISKNQKENIYKIKNDTKPRLTAKVIRDSSLYKNKYVLIFNASDKKTGIKEVVIKEGNHKWKKIESPYLLEDQTRHSIITLQATNYSGSSIFMNIDSLPSKTYSLVNIILNIVLLLLLIIIIKKIYEKYK